MLSISSFIQAIMRDIFFKAPLEEFPLNMHVLYEGMPLTLFVR